MSAGKAVCSVFSVHWQRERCAIKGLEMMDIRTTVAAFFPMQEMKKLLDQAFPLILHFNLHFDSALYGVATCVVSSCPFTQ